jgi:hypothetical protein
LPKRTCNTVWKSTLPHLKNRVQRKRPLGGYPHHHRRAFKWNSPEQCLAGAVELVSPANKDRPSHREALVSKCVTYLQAGVGLVLVDVVTERPADLHRELLLRLGVADPGPGPALSGSAYRCVERDGVSVLDVWREAIAVGQTLPTLPLWLRGGLCLPVELEATYERTCIEQRVQPAA